MKEMSNNSSINKVGYLIVISCAIIFVIVVVSLFFSNEDIIWKIVLVILLPYLVKIYLPWIQFKRRIYIDKANGKIINSVGYKEDVKEKEYKISDIKDYSVIRIAAAKEIVAKDPTLIFPNDSSTRAFYSIGYVEFEDGEILALDYGSKRKLKKKLSKFKSYIEER